MAIGECLAVADEAFLGDLLDVGSFATAGGTGEVLVHQLGVEADRFENLRAAIRGNRRDAHLGHRLDHALDRTFEEVVDRLVEVDVHHLVRDHLVDRVEGHVGVDRVGAEADERREVVDFAGFAGFEHDGNFCACARADQVVVESTHDQQRGHRRVGRADVAVGNDEDVEAIGDRLVGCGADLFETFFEARAVIVGDKKRIERRGLEAAERNFAELCELLVVDERIVEADQAARVRAGIEQVAFRADEGLGGGDEFFADAIERRVGDLGEDLLEVLVEMFRFVRKHGEGRVVAHRCDRLHTAGGGGPEQHAEILVGVTESELTL